MKNWFAVLAGALFLIPIQKSHAEVYWLPLGGTLDPTQCSTLAWESGYPYYSFGGYVYGIYYWNECFGGYEPTQSPTQQSVWYWIDVPTQGSDSEVKQRLTQCISTIESTIYGVRCYRDKEDNFLTSCFYQGFEDSAQVKQQLQELSCTESVEGPFGGPSDSIDWND